MGIGGGKSHWKRIQMLQLSKKEFFFFFRFFFLFFFFDMDYFKSLLTVL